MANHCASTNEISNIHPSPLHPLHPHGSIPPPYTLSTLTAPVPVTTCKGSPCPPPGRERCAPPPRSWRPAPWGRGAPGGSRTPSPGCTSGSQALSKDDLIYRWKRWHWMVRMSEFRISAEFHIAQYSLRRNSIWRNSVFVGIPFSSEFRI